MNMRPDGLSASDLKSALEYLKSDEGSLLPSTLFALSDLDQRELQQFATAWQTLSPERRRRTALAMVELAEERIEADFTRIFRYLLDDEDAQVRAHAIDGLWEDEDPHLVRPFIGALRSDPSSRVRAAAAEGLGRFLLLSEIKRIPATYGDEIQPALLAAVRNGGEDTLVRRRAIEAIAYLGDETVRDIVASAYADDDVKMRATAIFAMGRSADPYWKRTVQQELYSLDPQIRYEAARAIGELEVKAAVPRLIELLDDPDREVQGAAITALGQVGGTDARRALVELIQGPDPVAGEIAQDALDELEFGSGASLLLYDLGLESEEQALLDDDMDEDAQAPPIDEEDEEDELDDYDEEDVEEVGEEDRDELEDAPDDAGDPGERIDHPK
jgi:HEAT repeat protein